MAFTYDVAMFRDTFEHEFTWLNGFLRNVGRFAERPALHCPASGRRWTYRALNADANRLAHALTADGVGGNSVIMYMLLNSPEFAFCYLAGHKTGAVSCPVNYRLAPGELALIIDDSTPEIFVYDLEFAETARQALDFARHKPRRVVAVGEGAPAGPAIRRTGNTWRAGRGATLSVLTGRTSTTKPRASILPAPPTGPRPCPSTTSMRCSPPTT